MSAQNDLSELSLEELFRLEAETHAAAMTTGLLALERGGGTPAVLEDLMRAAHSLKGAARIVDYDAAVQVAHAMEDCFVAAQHSQIKLGAAAVDALLAGVDLLAHAANAPGETVKAEEVARRISAIRTGALVEPAAVTVPETRERVASPPIAEEQRSEAEMPQVERNDRFVRVTAENLNRLLGLAGESLVESRWPRPFSDQLLRLKRMHTELAKSLEALHGVIPPGQLSQPAEAALRDAQRRTAECTQFLMERMEELDGFDRRGINLAHRLHQEVLDCRMRPFADGVQAFPRMVRDLARSLGKEARLEIAGAATAVDRDVLQKLEAPLTHLLRNAVDHGVEPVSSRLARGKAPEAVIKLEARHAFGMLLITVSDDGEGIDLEALRRSVVARGLSTAELTAQMSEAELLEFLFLPGFSMKQTVTEISGRGVGLDAVRNFVQQIRGSVRVFTQPGAGTRFQLTLPLTVSVLRALLVDIAGEPYAFPLAHIGRAMKVPKSEIHSLEGRQHFFFGGQSIGLVTAHQVFERGEASPAEEITVIILGERGHQYALVVDRLLGEQELVVQALDPRLGKVKDISAAALTADGAPALIVDVDDLLRSIDKLVNGGRLSAVRGGAAESSGARRRRVLVVDDSLTVRELERKLLRQHGYEVEVAVDGMDGWNAARTGNFDLILTDVDMPRMDGVELITLVKRDPNLKSVPTVIVSYKDRPEDRQRGLDAGADYYLTKGSFHDDTLVNAVIDLIGEATA